MYLRPAPPTTPPPSRFPNLRSISVFEPVLMATLYLQAVGHTSRVSHLKSRAPMTKPPRIPRIPTRTQKKKTRVRIASPILILILILDVDC
ncbi:hypothetical protein BDN71DRAFT_1501980 [Pleurotus eryngii]|uniref:Uncharacterized protein n=1 Tax=Pleurotus eryngii TaxID=5323 RepID=A0A9P6DDH1_PLEER|nr:hypothetical protein BDN71DRAFT_1501980 [Pleurotus eryngii]